MGRFNWKPFFLAASNVYLCESSIRFSIVTVKNLLYFWMSLLSFPAIFLFKSFCSSKYSWLDNGVLTFLQTDEVLYEFSYHVGPLHRWRWMVFVVWLTEERRLALFPAGTIVRDPHHRESPTRPEQGLNLRRTWVQA